MGIAGVASITAICFFAADAIKHISKFKKEFLPLICGTIGLVLGIVGFYLTNNFPADNVIDAIGIGIASGFAATGIHQAGKQIKKTMP